MWPTKRQLSFALLAWALGASARAEGEDPFSRWQAGGFIQVLGLERPTGLTPAGPLDSDSHEATGLARDGLFVRKLETKLWGPLRPLGWSATFGVQTDLLTTSLTDILVQKDSASGRWTLKAGQLRLPFGQENQLSSAKILGVQRSLALGFGNYGHVDNWGLGLLAERGYGARLDLLEDRLGWLRGGLQLGAFQVKGQSFSAAAAGVGRAYLRLGSPTWGLEWGASGHVSRANLGLSSAQYAPLGSQSLPRALWEQGPGIGGKATILTWGQDLGLDLGLLHGRGEFELQSLGEGLSRGGGKASVELELPLNWERLPYLYGSADQASSSFADGVHRSGALYRALAFGFACPLPWHSSLKFESLKVNGDDFPFGFASDQVYQGQWQADF